MSTDTQPPMSSPVSAIMAAQRERRSGKPKAAIPAAKPAVPESDLTPQEQAVARQQWKMGKCTWCGGLHMRACPRVRSFEFANDGKTVVKIEFWPDGQWPDTNIIWPEDMGWSDENPAPA